MSGAIGSTVCRIKGSAGLLDRKSCVWMVWVPQRVTDIEQDLLDTALLNSVRVLDHETMQACL